MTSRLNTDVLLMQSYAKQIQALCTVMHEALDEADQLERAEVEDLIELARRLGDGIDAFARRYPPARDAPLPGMFA